MFVVPEIYRWGNHPVKSSSKEDGNNGFFNIPHPRIKGQELRCMISDGMGWQHVSVSVGELRKQPHRCPNWEEMCFIKNLFWTDDETVVQYHPAKENYRNIHNFVLHLWKPYFEKLPFPLNENEMI